MNSDVFHSFLIALINLLKFLMSNETVLLAKHNIFTLALMVSVCKRSLSKHTHTLWNASAFEQSLFIEI